MLNFAPALKSVPTLKKFCIWFFILHLNVVSCSFSVIAFSLVILSSFRNFNKYICFMYNFNSILNWQLFFIYLLFLITDWNSKLEFVSLILVPRIKYTTSCLPDKYLNTELAQRHSACLACARPWIRLLVPKKKIVKNKHQKMCPLLRKPYSISLNKHDNMSFQTSLLLLLM